MEQTLAIEYKFRLVIDYRENTGNCVPTLNIQVVADVPTRMTEKLVRMLVRRPEVEKWLRDELVDLATSPDVKWQPFGMSPHWIRATPIHNSNRMLIQLFSANSAEEAVRLAHELKIKVY